MTRLQSNQKKIVTMSDLAERPPRTGVKRALLRWSRESEKIRSPLLRYGLSVICCAIATGLALILYRDGIRGMELGLLCLPVAIATWYGGIGPSVLAVLLCTASFNYFFVEPFLTFYVAAADAPYFLTFVGWAALIAIFSAVRRRVEDSLRQTRDRLQIEVEQRAQREEDIRRLNRGASEAGCGTRGKQQGTGIVCLLGVPRPARAASPCRRVHGAVAKTGPLFTRRQESPVLTNDSRFSQENG